MSMSGGIGPIAEWREVDTATFRERIYPTHEPAVLRGAVRQWPAVQRGSPSAQAMCGYLLGLPQGAPVPLLTAEPSVKGRLFFREDMQRPNFQRQAVPLACLHINRLRRQSLRDAEPSPVRGIQQLAIRRQRAAGEVRLPPDFREGFTGLIRVLEHSGAPP